MTSRDKILNAVGNNQPPFREAESIDSVLLRELPGDRYFLLDQYIAAIQAIGGHCRAVSSYADIAGILKDQFPEALRVVSTLHELKDVAEICPAGQLVAMAEEVDVAVIAAHFGVAENGAVWVTDDMLCGRAFTVICQHLVAVIRAEDIVADMHEAYERIGERDYGFAVFIAGPSKTADIEQSLVLGAHGPISMTVFILI